MRSSRSMDTKKNFDVESFVESMDSDIFASEPTSDKHPCPYCGSEEYEELIKARSKRNRRRMVVTGCSDCE